MPLLELHHLVRQLASEGQAVLMACYGLFLAPMFVDQAFLTAHGRLVAYCTSFLTGMRKPTHSLVLDAVRVVILLAPLAFVCSQAIGVDGVFWGRVGADITAGVVGMLRVRRAITLDPGAQHPPMIAE